MTFSSWPLITSGRSAITSIPWYWRKGYIAVNAAFQQKSCRVWDCFYLSTEIRNLSFGEPSPPRCWPAGWHFRRWTNRPIGRWSCQRGVTNLFLRGIKLFHVSMGVWLWVWGRWCSFDPRAARVLLLRDRKSYRYIRMFPRVGQTYLEIGSFFVIDRRSFITFVIP